MKKKEIDVDRRKKLDMEITKNKKIKIRWSYLYDLLYIVPIFVYILSRTKKIVRTNLLSVNLFVRTDLFLSGQKGITTK